MSNFLWDAFDRNLQFFGVFATLATPFFVGAVFLIFWLIEKQMSERLASRLLIFSIMSGCIGAGYSLAICQHLDIARIEFDINGVDFLFDLPSLIFVFMSQIFLGAISRFSSNYLHRDSKFGLFMGLFVLLQLGVNIVASAVSMVDIFMGWEGVGVASFLLIGFFSNNTSAGRGSLTAFVSYKMGDVGLILAAAILTQYGNTSAAGLALILGTLAKGGQFPFMQWVPRAMEGPTPSSAAFYGAVSVHLAPFLLYRLSSVWFGYDHLRVLVVIIGSITVIISGLIGRTRSNIKSQLAYAVMGQIGIIYVELALGLHQIALLHMLSHASLRSVQFLRSGSVIFDYHRTATSHGKYTSGMQTLKSNSRFIHAWNGFYFDAITKRVLFDPVMKLAIICANILDRHLNRVEVHSRLNDIMRRGSNV